MRKGDRTMALKHVLMGAGLQLTLKSIDALGYYALSSVYTQAQIHTIPWYIGVLDPWLPPLDDWVLDLGLPAGLYATGKLTEKRNPARAGDLKDMGVGAALTGVGTFMHELINRVGNNAFTRKAGEGYVGEVPFNIDYGATNIIRGMGQPRNPSPVTTHAERLPFQTDLSY